jgi:sugar/nucleoside kinase (ribokinase family)
VPGIPTGSAFVSYNDDDSRDFVYNIAQSAASRFDTSTYVIEKLSAFGLDFMHVSGSALADPEMARKILTLCRATRATGTKISLDPNVRKELASDLTYFRTLRELMSMASIFLPSEEDAALLFPGEPLATFGRVLREQGIEYVVLKRGDKGAEAMSREGEHVDLAAHKVEVLDPTGAGDCFCATFVSSIAAGVGFRQALERANAAGALAVTCVGPMEGNSNLARIDALLRSGR